MATSGQPIKAQRKRREPSTFSCRHCRGYKGDHTRQCPIFQRNLIDSMEMDIRWDEDDLENMTDRKARNKLLARIERRAKTLARLRGQDYNRTERDADRSMRMLDELMRKGQQ